MSEQWLEIRDTSVDAEVVRRRVRERVSLRHHESSWAAQIDPGPEDVVDSLREGMFDSAAKEPVAVEQQDCDIIPRDYTIDWRVPILGPIHALIRRVINAEVRRYLMPALERQSYLNREFLRTLSDLREENDRLRRRIAELQRDHQEGPGP